MSLSHKAKLKECRNHLQEGLGCNLQNRPGCSPWMGTTARCHILIPSSQEDRVCVGLMLQTGMKPDPFQGGQPTQKLVNKSLGNIHDRNKTVGMMLYVPICQATY